jgi:hypothetical protein
MGLDFHPYQRTVAYCGTGDERSDRPRFIPDGFEEMKTVSAGELTFKRMLRRRGVMSAGPLMCLLAAALVAIVSFFIFPSQLMAQQPSRDQEHLGD